MPEELDLQVVHTALEQYATDPTPEAAATVAGLMPRVLEALGDAEAGKRKVMAAVEQRDQRLLRVPGAAPDIATRMRLRARRRPHVPELDPALPDLCRICGAPMADPVHVAP